MKHIQKSLPALVLIIGIVFLSSFTGLNNNANQKPKKGEDHPKIVNIINFIRLLEPRDPLITQDVLYQTVLKQVEIMKKYNLGGTFLLQYDALMDNRYQKLLKTLSRDSFEIGGWWEIPQPLVEKAGLKWRGRYPWDWHANVGFSTGYTPAEREKLIDIYMHDFKEIFGYYPKSVGSWFIDAHSLNYMYEKYHIIASCNCKDQSGTDGYTLWGGYWNQAYYPSKINSYMPAQNEENQLPVPIFRMLGSDPIRQYDTGLGTSWQGVITLEPVYPKAGGNSEWVNWFFREFVEGNCMEYNYTQAGQENSFTWDAMKNGFELQMPLIASLRNQKKIKVETLAESGQWFKNRYKVTPATSMTVKNDLNGSDFKTVWFNSRYFRVNFLWEDSTLRIRDIHIFNEKFLSIYTSGVTTSNQASFFTLPFVDGFLWSTPQQTAGLRLMSLVNGREIALKGQDPIITDSITGLLHIIWPLKSTRGNIVIDLNEQELKIRVEGNKTINWFFDLTTADHVLLPFKNIVTNKIDCQFENINYKVTASQGTFSKPDKEKIFRISPVNNSITLNFKVTD